MVHRPGLLFIIALLITCNTAYSQKDVLTGTFYEKINGKYLKKNVAYFNLHGKVKSIKETYSPEKPKPSEILRIIVSNYHFSEKGFLIDFLEGDTSKSRYRFEKYEYHPVTGHLKSMVTRGDYYATTSTMTFNSLGFVVQERFVSGTENALDYKASYKYNASFTQLSISYQYDLPEAAYERNETEIYKFTFDQKGNLTQESLRGKYGYNKSISFDSLLNLPATIFHVSICATANSCSIYNISRTYDKTGNLVSESMADHTIRNSTWTNSYCYSYQLNNKKEIIEKTSCSIADDFRWRRNGETDDGKTIYEYEYDTSGNWISKTEYHLNSKSAKELISVTKREIKYY